MQGSRPARIGEEIRQELADLLSREVRDPGIGFVTVTHVKVSADLQVARAYYTTLGDEAARRTTAKALERAKPFLRQRIAARVGLRRAPELAFQYDESIAREERIESLLQEIRQSPRRRRAATPAPPRRSRPTRGRQAKAGPLPGPAMSSAAVAMDILVQIRDAIRARSSFLLTSHARPDGDSIGSQVALAAALRALGKSVRMVNRDRPPSAVPGPARRRRDRGRAERRGRLRRAGRARVQRRVAAGRGRPRGLLHDQHRPPPRQRDVRGDQLVRRQRRGVRRTGRGGDRRARRAVDAGDRIGRLPGHPHRHRRLPSQPHHQPHLRVVPPRHRSRRRRRGAGPAGLRAELDRQAEADWRAPRRDGSDRRRQARRPRLRRRAARPHRRDGGRHRRADQHAADVGRHPGRRSWCAANRAATSASACARRAPPTSAWSRPSSAAAATPTRRASRAAAIPRWSAATSSTA